ncbi:MAG: pyridoxal kinase [Pseudooceanicola sp.]|nr:pyridoxal kinase [Pseudooceanicola sp.]
MRIVMLSSWVASGHVGLSAGAPMVQALGHEVVQLPTVMLSNHPGFPPVSGRAVDVAQLAGMAEALEANGWLVGVDALLTGYLPSAAHVEFAAALAARLRARVVVDPVLGDVPKGLYVPGEVAEAIRDRLVPRADVLTPNLFELSWLTGMPVRTLAEVTAAARALGREVLVTSAPSGPGRIGVLRVADRLSRWSAPMRAGVPQGTGDAFAALIAAGLPVGAALGHLAALVDTSLNTPHLRIAESARDWTAAPPIPEDAQPLDAS